MGAATNSTKTDISNMTWGMETHKIQKQKSNGGTQKY